MTKLDKSSKKVTIEDFSELENIIGSSLPLEFKNLYVEYNGGVPEKNIFYDEETEEELEVNLFFPLKFPSDILGKTLEEKYDDYNKKNIIPEKYLSFANDWGGNVFCIDTNPLFG